MRSATLFWQHFQLRLFRVTYFSDATGNHSANETRGMFEVFLGGEHRLFSDWIVQPGLAYSQAGYYEVTGTLTQGLAPQSADQFSYNYNVLTRQLLAQAKLMYSFRQVWHPYLLLGLGASFNSVSNYATSIPTNLISTRLYANKENSSFSYRVGLGFDVDVFSHARLGVAYRFSGLGQANLGGTNINGTSVPGTLTQSELNANEVLFQLTYII